MPQQTTTLRQLWAGRQFTSHYDLLDYTQAIHESALEAGAQVVRDEIVMTPEQHERFDKILRDKEAALWPANDSPSGTQEQ